jgi:hypothetical protein
MTYTMHARAQASKQLAALRLLPVPAAQRPHIRIYKMFLKF